MKEYPIHVREMLRSLWLNRYLLKKFIQREVTSRYKGTFLGIFWSIIQPFFMLIVYTFVFSVVFKARWHGGSDSRVEFALILFSGLMVFTLFADCVNRAPRLILDNSNYVKRVIFPLEVLPWITLGGAVFNFMVSFFVWLCSSALLLGTPPLTIILLPVVLLPLCFFTIGISYFLASLGVFLVDVNQIITIVTTAMLFLTPIFYSAENLEASYRIFLYLNPLTLVVEQCRGILLWGRVPEMVSLLLQYGVSLAVCWLGFAWFQKTRKGFADVI